MCTLINKKLINHSCSLLIILFIAGCYQAHAQDRAKDSLQALLQKSAKDSGRVNILLSLNKELMSSDPARAIGYANDAKKLAAEIGYPRGVAYGYKGIGLVNLMQGKYIESLENFDRSLAIFDSLGDKPGQANILNNQATVYFNQADDEKALELYLKALQIAEQTTDSVRISTLLLNIGAIYSHKTATQPKALDYLFQARAISRSLSDREIIATVNVNIGEIYLIRNNVDSALVYFRESLREYNGSENTPYALNNIGKAYQKKKEFDNAINYHTQAYNFAKKIDAPIDLAQSLLGLGDSYMEKKEPVTAILYYRQADSIARTISPANEELKYAYTGLALAYATLKDYENAYKYQTLYTSIKDSLYNIDTDRKLSSLQFTFDIQKKQAQVDLLTKDKLVQGLQLKRQKTAKNILLVGLGIGLIFASVLYRNYRNKIRINKILDSQKAQIEGLLLNILPAEVAQELQDTGHATPRYYEFASVLFTDFKSFSKLADELSPQQVVSELNECFYAFDQIVEKYNIEKIKTIGDSYMCAGGIPTEDPGHVFNIIKAAIEMQEFIKERNHNRQLKGLPPWDIRTGVHTGPLVAGVVGKSKYAYDIWGSTVNIASRMESNGEPGKVNISHATYELIKDQYVCTYRGKISAKNIGDVDMYFVEREVKA